MDLRELIEREGLENSSYEDIVAALNENPLVANPEEQGSIPVPSKMADFLTIVQASDTAEADLAIVIKVSELVKAGEIIGNHLGIPSDGNAVGLVGLLEAHGVNSESISAMKNKLTETRPDPSYQAQVPGPSLAEEAGLPVVTNEDVQEALL